MPTPYDDLDRDRATLEELRQALDAFLAKAATLRAKLTDPDADKATGALIQGFQDVWADEGDGGALAAIDQAEERLAELLGEEAPRRSTALLRPNWDRFAGF